MMDHDDERAGSIRFFIFAMLALTVAFALIFISRNAPKMESAREMYEAEEKLAELRSRSF